jgi:phosphohistidine phosphatase SixA
MIEIVLARHGARQRCGDDGLLSERGWHQAATLARALHLRMSTPDTILSSARRHAWDTADQIGRQLPRPVIPVALDCLTPDRGPGTIEDLLEQADRKGVHLGVAHCVLVVGHEGRLSDLVVELTGSRARPIPHGGAVAIRGDSLVQLVSGRGSLYYRVPTVDHQEDVLREKVTSKMTVATFLAGFVFTALSAVLLLARPWPLHRVFAITALTASLALFVSTVYIYDQLATPSGFWTDAGKPKPWWKKLYEHRERRLDKRWARLMHSATAEDDDHRARVADDDAAFHRSAADGPMYWLMVKTSRWVFTPAVVLALAGFVALLLGTEDARILIGGVVALLIGGTYAAFHRPDLGAD